MPTSIKNWTNKLNNYKLRHQLPWKPAAMGIVLAFAGVFFIFRSFAATVPVSACDLNNDKVVNLTDLSILLSNFNKTGPTGDIDSNGTVNLTDLSILLSNYGKTVSVTPPPTTPPPSTPDILPPSNIKAMVGGNSIALRWNASVPTTGTVKQYDIFRDGTQIGSVVPTPQPVGCAELNGNCYVDSTITRGTTYQYQIRAVSSSNTNSALSSNLAASSPTTGAGEPDITVNYNSVSGLDSVMDSKILPTLKVMYPKLSNTLMGGDYVPPADFTINIDATNSITQTVKVAGTTMTINSDYAKANQNTPRYLLDTLYGATQVIMNINFGDGKLNISWLNNSIPRYLQAYYYHGSDPVQPQGADSYTFGREPTAYFLNWIQEKYDPNYIHKAAMGIANRNLTTNYIEFSGGKIIDELWAELLGKPLHSGPIVQRSSGKCLDIENGSVDDNAQVRLWPCNGATAQKFTIELTRSGMLEIHGVGKCLTGTISSPYYGRMADCDLIDDNKWYALAGSEILENLGITKFDNNVSNCLDTVGSGMTEGTRAVIQRCNYIDQTSLSWQRPAKSPFTNAGYFKFVTNTTKCVDLPSGITTNGTQLQVWDCNQQTPQAVNVGVGSDQAAKMVILGKCIGVENDGTANDSKVVISACVDSKAQLWKGDGNKLTNLLSGKCLDTTTGAVANSLPLVIHDCNSNAAQQLQL